MPYIKRDCRCIDRRVTLPQVVTLSPSHPFQTIKKARTFAHNLKQSHHPAHKNLTTPHF
jgi:hypothetical protein